MNEYTDFPVSINIRYAIPDYKDENRGETMTSIISDCLKTKVDK